MQSSRLVVTLNNKMETGFESGINEIYKNSHLINDFVVRPSFLLAPTETLWGTFQNAEENPTVQLKSSMLARKTTVANSTKQVVNNNESQIVQTTETGYEYYLQLPDDVLINAGPWYFSLEIREIPDSATPEQYESISTSDFNTFTVHNSLAGANADGSTPTDLDIAGLYKTATEASAQSAQSAAEAANSAEEAANSAEEAKQAAEDVIESNRAPYIGENGHWYQYDKSLQEFVDTGVNAQGPEWQPYVLTLTGNVGAVTQEQLNSLIGQDGLVAPNCVIRWRKDEDSPFVCLSPIGNFAASGASYLRFSATYRETEGTASAPINTVLSVNTDTKVWGCFEATLVLNSKLQADYATKTYVQEQISASVTSVLNTPV